LYEKFTLLLITYIESTPSELGLRIDAQSTLDWLNNKGGKLTSLKKKKKKKKS
jgi:hypothetical protein